MIEANINNITKYYGADLIFENVSFTVHTNERIGLIGPNGCGKTTVLKILIGKETIQTGDITFRKNAKIGYLDQIPHFSDDVTVESILQSAKEDVYYLKQKLHTLAESFSTMDGTALEHALEQYSVYTHQYEQLGGYTVETDINIVATGLKINDTMRDMPFNLLSGGEKTRVMLARILLEHPTVLLLDEPSNHLDLESIEWLEGYLSTYDGSVLIVSHDRYFLDNVCQKIVELSTHRSITYHGNYSYYVIERERRFLLELKAYLAQEKQIKRMEEQIKRYRIWGEMRDSDKMFKRAKELERRLEKIDRLDKPIKDNKKVKLRTSGSSRSGKRVLEATHIHKQFDDLVLFEDASIDVLFQDRLAILGRNGSGKTTLIKLLLDDYQKEEPLYKWGSKVSLGYLPQEVLFPDESLSVLEHFMKEHNLNQNDARRELAQALFIRDDVFKKISTLSGGEKSKLILRSLTYNKVNVMVLDEPTNHLDIDSREVLEEMLLEFEGTIIFVSHDRYFIQKIANRIGELENQTIRFYEGDYNYYKIIKSREQK
jgi:ATPase subunit of ABC transporter with duplicated ATPase domains